MGQSSLEMMVSVPGARLFCAVQGGPQPRPEVLLAMHGGLGLDHSYLRPWLDPLAARRRVVYYDHRGNGRSENSDGSPLRHDVLADDAEALARHLGADDVVVLGHSYGSFVALEYALRHPRRLRGLILCNSTPVLDYPEALAAEIQRRGEPRQREALGRLLRDPPQDDGEFARLWRAALPLYFHRQQGEARYDAMAAAVRCRAAAYAEAVRDNLPRYDVTARLPLLRAPTLVVAGAQDPFMPPAQGAARLVAGIPGAELALFEGSGHHPFIEEPERFCAVVLDFLERCHRSVGDRQAPGGA